MKRLLILLSLALCAVTAAQAQDLSCTFTQKKTLKAVNKVIPGSGTVTFTAPDHLSMIYDEPKGEYLIIEGMQLKNAVKGKAITVDTSKNAYMRNLRNTLLNCITGNYEAAAKDNDANLVVEEKSGIKTVTLLARKQAVKGYSRIVMDYNREGLPVRMVLDEFTGIETEYTFKY